MNCTVDFTKCMPIVVINSPDTPLLPLPVSISPLSQYSKHSLEADYPGSYLSDEVLSLNQLREPDITYLFTPSPKLVLPTYSNNDNNEQMEKLVNCRKFGGYPHENAAIFISEFESHVTLHNISPLDDNRKIATLHLHLTGPALTWFNALSSEHKSSWDRQETVRTVPLAAVKMGEACGYRKAELQVAAASKHPKSNDKLASDFAALQSQIDTLTKMVQDLTLTSSKENAQQNRRTDRFSYSRSSTDN
ncbi:unnamed protein product [Mytilus coruscus]|uniref:Retrotransposon gag domain-containing protein n=1 Tax=Mytilus coruscus TaxID=42192 RepID=A0A6J8EL44_MYTCO|nr:unnamed protein product [Mytilus coruscus]